MRCTLVMSLFSRDLMKMQVKYLQSFYIAPSFQMVEYQYWLLFKYLISKTNKLFIMLLPTTYVSQI